MPPPAADRLALHTAPSILRRAAALLSALLPSLLLTTLLLFSFRTALLAGVRHLSLAADHNPSFHSLLSRLSSPPPPPTNSPAAPAPRRFRHVSAPAADSPDSLLGPSLSDSFAFTAGAPRNGSFSFLAVGNAAFRFFYSRKPVKLPPPAKISSQFNFLAVGNDDDERTKPQPRGSGIILDRGDALAIIRLLVLLSTAHAAAIVGFVMVYSAALGVVFTGVANHYLDRPTSAVSTFFTGALLGVRRLAGFAFLRWAARDAIVQFLCLWFFADVKDQTQLFKMFVAAKLMPFSLSSGSASLMAVTGGAALSRFFFAWGFLDSMVSMLFMVVPWVAIMDWDPQRPRRGHDAVKEGCYLVYLMPGEATMIKWTEVLLCGSFVRAVLVMVCGRLLGGVLYSLVVVYFMVVWLTFYLAARCKDAQLDGRRFGLEDLADCIDRPT